MWTRKSVGCACSWRDNEHDHAKDKHEATERNVTHGSHHKHPAHQLDCACCVKGGCQCGKQAPNRCSQCGLENHCLNSELSTPRVVLQSVSCSQLFFRFFPPPRVAHSSSSVCNVTLDSKLLQASSGQTFGQIRSPIVQGPSLCYYALRPAPGQRVELQVYRLVAVGKFNGKK